MKFYDMIYVLPYSLVQKKNPSSTEFFYKIVIFYFCFWSGAGQAKIHVYRRQLYNVSSLTLPSCTC